MSRGDIKLLGEPEEPPQEPTFPSVQFQLTQQGLIINILLAPGTTIVQGIGEQHMNEICKGWLESRRALKKQLEMIQHINKTKV